MATSSITILNTITAIAINTININNVLNKICPFS